MTDYSTIIWQNETATINFCEEDLIPNSFVLEVTAETHDGRIVSISKFMSKQEILKMVNALESWVK